MSRTITRQGSGKGTAQLIRALVVENDDGIGRGDSARTALNEGVTVALRAANALDVFVTALGARVDNLDHGADEELLGRAISFATSSKDTVPTFVTHERTTLPEEHATAAAIVASTLSRVARMTEFRTAWDASAHVLERSLRHRRRATSFRSVRPSA